MKEYAEKFYKSKRWQRTAEAYKKSIGGLCERCIKKGMYNPVEIVHHKTYITPSNINNPDIALSFDNLEGLCRECHAQEHNHCVSRYKILENGDVVSLR